MKISLLLSTLALTSIVLAMTTTGRDKKLLEALLGKMSNNDLTLEQDKEAGIPPVPYYGIDKPTREEKKDALLQAVQLSTKDDDDYDDDGLAREQLDALEQEDPDLFAFKQMNKVENLTELQAWKKEAKTNVEAQFWNVSHRLFCCVKRHFKC